MDNVVLIGYRGSGKTTVGRLLAQRLKYALVDTDTLVVEQAGKTIAAIFAEEGESTFRELETRAITAAAVRSRIVLSVGGGAVLRDDNMRRLRGCGTTFWLAADAETLWARMRGDVLSVDNRPALTGQPGLAEVRHGLRERENLYKWCAHYCIQVADRTPAQVADAIVTLLTLNPHRP